MILKTKDLQDALEYVNSILECSDLSGEIKNLETLRALCNQALDKRTLSWVTTKSGNKQLRHIVSMNNFDDVFGFVVEKKFEDKSKFLAALDVWNPLKDKSEYSLEADTENLAMAFVEEQALAKGLLIRR